ncbi:MAG: hypothetical protein SGJ23_14820, partial [Alphaproteobacteria bacterium]|nr:hypothetical protein [Alphaproteobacteria bacterium]
MTLLSFLPEIAVPPAHRRHADAAMHTARRGLIKLMGQFGDPEDVPRRNHVEPRAIAWARTQLRRLHDIVRYTLALFAIHLDVPPLKARVNTASTHAPKKPVTQEAKTWRVNLRLLRSANVPTGRPAPPHLVHATHDPLLSLARSMEALRRVLANPLPHARRLARAIRASTVVARFRQLNAKPPEGRDDYFAERRDMLHTTAWALDMFYRPKRYR